MGFKLRSGQSLRNINVSEEIYGAGGNDGSIISRPDTECIECDDACCAYDSDEANDTCSLFLTLLFIIEVGFNIFYSVLGMFETTINDVWSKCPGNHIWIYLLTTTVVLNFIHHVGVKSLREIRTKKELLLAFFIIQISNLGFSLFGDYYSSGKCVSEQFDTTLLWKMVNYNIILQKSFCILLFIPETGLIYRIYVKNNQGENKKVKHKEVENGVKDTEKEKEKLDEENIKITILECKGERERDEYKDQNHIITHKETD